MYRLLWRISLLMLGLKWEANWALFGYFLEETLIWIQIKTTFYSVLPCVDCQNWLETEELVKSSAHN